MDRETQIDFITALCEEYWGVISKIAEQRVVPQDGYDVFSKAFGLDDLTPELLHLAQSSDSQMGMVRDVAREWHESDRIGVDHIREVVRRVLRRWPAGAPQ